MSVEDPAHDTSATLMMRLSRDPADGRAWEEFVHRYRPMIRDWCLKRGARPDVAEDVAQEVLVKLLGAFKGFRYDPARSFRAWLRTVTRNAWSDFARHHRPESAADGDGFGKLLDSMAAAEDLGSRLEDAFDRELVDLAMSRVERRVKPLNWRAFRLTAIDGLAGAEAAKELEMTVARVFIAKHRVQKMLEEEVRILGGEST
ncbi:RNA polymerase sigma factor [Aquisphaera insulae]|uniref:RNA polymerase sigma factor n=1 Tax=Aquisphaera insulae TaxID=2712864 RepID=UPI0013E9FCE8|nr:sigma-70 family RNA polymerase sigma factor [Aquisphaera insulae]